MKHLEIEKVIGREIIDSRGNPTVEAEVYLTDGPHQAAHLQVSLKHWSCVTVTRAVLAEKVF
jgi:enolase